METALIAAGAVICGSLVTGGLAIWQARLNADAMVRQANLVADRGEHQRRYEHKAEVFAEYLAASILMSNVISEASEKRSEILAELRRSNPSASSEDLGNMATHKIQGDTTATPEWKRWQALGMQVRLFIEPEEEQVLVDWERQAIYESARIGVSGDRGVMMRTSASDGSRSLMQVMRDHLSRHAKSSGS